MRRPMSALVLDSSLFRRERSSACAFRAAITTPTRAPCASSSGAARRWTNSLCPLWSRSSVSPPPARPATASATTSAIASEDLVVTSSMMRRPSTSGRSHPSSRSAAAFQDAIVPLRSVTITATGAWSINPSVCARSRSAALPPRSVIACCRVASARSAHLFRPIPRKRDEREGRIRLPCTRDRPLTSFHPSPFWVISPLKRKMGEAIFRDPFALVSRRRPWAKNACNAQSVVMPRGPPPRHRTCALAPRRPTLASARQGLVRVPLRRLRGRRDRRSASVRTPLSGPTVSHKRQERATPADAPDRQRALRQVRCRLRETVGPPPRPPQRANTVRLETDLLRRSQTRTLAAGHRPEPRPQPPRLDQRSAGSSPLHTHAARDRNRPLQAHTHAAPQHTRAAPHPCRHRKRAIPDAHWSLRGHRQARRICLQPPLRLLHPRALSPPAAPPCLVARRRPHRHSRNQLGAAKRRTHGRLRPSGKQRPLLSHEEGSARNTRRHSRLAKPQLPPFQYAATRDVRCTTRSRPTLSLTS